MVPESYTLNAAISHALVSSAKAPLMPANQAAVNYQHTTAACITTLKNIN